jgi:hypothetical protein
VTRICLLFKLWQRFSKSVVLSEKFIYIYMKTADKIMSQDSLGGIVMGYGLDRQGLISGRGKRFFSTL